MAAIRPTWRTERALWREGRERVAGVDEVGRGPLAGPVVAAAVVLPFTRARWASRLRDSKLLSAAVREELAAEYLEDHGYLVIERNVRRREGEIDLVATRKRTLIFVEVKLRNAGPFGGAIEALTVAE